jgi:hypothetical protein
VKDELFHEDNQHMFDLHGLRRKTSRVVADSSLIRRAQRGEYKAAVALKIGFWPFVNECYRPAIPSQTTATQQVR